MTIYNTCSYYYSRLLAAVDLVIEAKFNFIVIKGIEFLRPQT